MMHESPTRPEIFHARPEVVVVPDISPFSFTARQLIVPVGGCATTCLIHGAQAWRSGVSSNSATCLLKSGASRPGRQSFELDAFHASHAMRDLSVSKFIGSNPWSMANCVAPRPTIKV